MSDANAPPVDPGAPKWTMTFADLMSLLLAFFVLLFSFSELDSQKYKQVAGSMRNAFGVQREVRADDPPRGINVVAQEFSAGRPQPTPMNTVRQFTTQDSQTMLKVPNVSERLQEKMSMDIEKIKESLKEEIDQGLLDVELDESRIVIRIRERGAFPSGSAELKQGFLPVMERMAQSLETAGGDIVVSGHTDNRPISTARFRSNWELSAARAVTVLHELIRFGDLQEDDMELQGFGATQPIAANDDPSGRAENRRVEVTVVYDEDQAPSALPSLDMQRLAPDPPEAVIIAPFS